MSVKQSEVLSHMEDKPLIQYGGDTPSLSALGPYREENSHMMDSDKAKAETTMKSIVELFGNTACAIMDESDGVQTSKKMLTDMTNEYKTIATKHVASLDVNSVEKCFKEHSKAPWWRESCVYWVNFVIKTWPIEGKINQVDMMQEKLILLETVVPMLLQKPQQQAVRSLGLPAPTVALESGESKNAHPTLSTRVMQVEEDLRIPAGITLRDTATAQLMIEREHLKDIDPEYLKIDLLLLPSSGIADSETGNKQIFGVNTGTEMNAAVKHVKENLQAIDMLQKFDPRKTKGLAFKWLRKMEQFCSYEDAQLRLLYILHSLAGEFRSQILTLCNLKIVKAQPLGERYRWVLATMRIEFSKEIYHRKAEEVVNNLSKHEGESLADFGARVKNAIQGTRMAELKPSDTRTLIDRFVTGLNSKEEKNFAGIVKEDQFASFDAFLDRLETKMDHWRRKCDSQEAIELNAVETRFTKRSRTEEDQEEHKGDGMSFNKADTFRTDGRVKQMGVARASNFDVKGNQPPQKGGGKRCWRCDVVGHGSLDCPAPEPSRTRERCMRCGRTGHDRKGCKKRLYACGRCGSFDHDACVCPNPTKSVGPEDS